MSLDRRTFLAGSTALGAGTLAGRFASAAESSAVPSPETDPIFKEPYIDVDEWRDKPERHRYVHGGWKGTEAKFVILFPPKERYQGRFFQHNTAVPTSELAAGNIWGGTFGPFCFDSGGAAVVTNQSGAGKDATYGSYKIAAAAARYTRVLANEMYGPHRCYGYAFGGSGGGYRTMSCAEHTDAFDGTVPYIHGNMQAWPNCYAGRARGQRALKHKMPEIANAMEPGGPDMYATLNEEERGILSEVTKLGFPPRAWVFHETMGVGPLTAIFPGIQRGDPTYFEDFWTKPGYLGFDKPETFKGVRVQLRTKVTRIIMSNEAAAAGLVPANSTGNRFTSPDPDEAWRTFQGNYGGKPLAVGLQLETPPAADAFLAMANMRVVSGESAGRAITFGGMNGNVVRFSYPVGGDGFRAVTEKMKVGDEVLIDNSNPLAYETMYRHALLTPDYYTGNQFRKPDGTPMYPQREKNISLELMSGSTPHLPMAKFHGKMIVIQNMLDWDAQPWYADWYRNLARQNYGAGVGDKYRLYYIDYATHGAIPDPTRTVPYSGALQQALRDVAAWAERGVAPPAESTYKVDDGQVILPARAADRKGIQSVVTLQANGGVRADVKAGQPVNFTATIEMPSGAGSIVAAEWDFDATPAVVAGDTNRFQVVEQIKPATRVTLKRTHTFTKPGTYYPALRAHSQRQGNASTPFARIGNLGRVRVVVT